MQYLIDLKFHALDVTFVLKIGKILSDVHFLQIVLLVFSMVEDTDLPSLARCMHSQKGKLVCEKGL